MDVSSLPEDKKGGVNPKVFIIGLPLFILQLIVVYFVTANILLSKMQSTGSLPVKATIADSLKAVTENPEKKEGESGVNIFELGDIIVNPTGTNGQRLLLASVGFDLPAKEQMDVFEKKKPLVTDIVISALSSKNLEQLNSITYRDTIKAEIKKTLYQKIQKIKVNNIYFSKFIIQ